MFALTGDRRDHQAEPTSCWAGHWQASLFALGAPAIDDSFADRRRHQLDDTSWVDHVPRWLAGSDEVFAELVARVPWRQRRVVMYDRLVDEPRLTWWWEGERPVPLAVLDEARHTLSARYGVVLDSMAANYYRDGSDSVAWHGDRVRFAAADPLVALVSVGSPRPFQLRRRGGGPSITYLLGQGDLLVMGGACQHDWEHAVPKVAGAGPRISVSFRHGARSPDDESPPVEVRHPSAHRPTRPAS